MGIKVRKTPTSEWEDLSRPKYTDIKPGTTDIVGGLKTGETLFIDPISGVGNVKNSSLTINKISDSLRKNLFTSDNKLGTDITPVLLTSLDDGAYSVEGPYQLYPEQEHVPNTDVLNISISTITNGSNITKVIYVNKKLINTKVIYLISSDSGVTWTKSSQGKVITTMDLSIVPLTGTNENPSILSNIPEGYYIISGFYKILPTDISNLSSSLKGLTYISKTIVATTETISILYPGIKLIEYVYTTGQTSWTVTETTLGGTGGGDVPIATTTTPGKVLPDGLSIIIDGTGKISVDFSKAINDTTPSLTKMFSSQKITDLLTGSGFIDNSVGNLLNYYTKTEVTNMISGISSITMEIVTELPTTNISLSTIYLMIKPDSGDGDIYDEYMYINSTWESIGNTGVDLSSYLSKSGLLTTTGTSTDNTMTQNAITEELTKKVDKVAGKSLSTNDLTQILVDNLNSAYLHSQANHAPTTAEQNVQSDWLVSDTTSDAYIKNKPTQMTPTNASVTTTKLASDVKNNLYYTSTLTGTVSVPIVITSLTEGRYRITGYYKELSTSTALTTTSYFDVIVGDTIINGATYYKSYTIGDDGLYTRKLTMKSIDSGVTWVEEYDDRILMISETAVLYEYGTEGAPIVIENLKSGYIYALEGYFKFTENSTITYPINGYTKTNQCLMLVYHEQEGTSPVSFNAELISQGQLKISFNMPNITIPATFTLSTETLGYEKFILQVAEPTLYGHYGMITLSEDTLTY